MNAWMNVTDPKKALCYCCFLFVCFPRNGCNFKVFHSHHLIIIVVTNSKAECSQNINVKKTTKKKTLCKVSLCTL